jgi:hypothetical protein
LTGGNKPPLSRKIPADPFWAASGKTKTAQSDRRMSGCKTSTYGHDGQQPNKHGRKYHAGEPMPIQPLTKSPTNHQQISSRGAHAHPASDDITNQPSKTSTNQQQNQPRTTTENHQTGGEA